MSYDSVRPRRWRGPVRNMSLMLFI